MNTNVTTPTRAPLWVLIPDALLPEPHAQRYLSAKADAVVSALPKPLKQALARTGEVPYHHADGLDVVEAWLLRHFDPEQQAKFDVYPAWAMINADGVPAFTRFMGTVGCLEIQRDGVEFTPPEALAITPEELGAFWAVVRPVLVEHGWQCPNDALLHSVLNRQEALPMEQASPWSIQGVRLTDYLPRSAETAQWRKMWLNLQVELHQAPFNQQRQERGLKPLNALWFWGGGHAWAARWALPLVKSVSSEGVFDAVVMRGEANPALNRLIFWNRVLGPLLIEQALAPSAVYCVDFEGWGGPSPSLHVLNDDVLASLSQVGVQVDWALMGQGGWVELHPRWPERLKFWQNAPKLNHMIEPSDGQELTEAELAQAHRQAALEQAQLQTLMQADEPRAYGPIDHRGKP